MAEIDTQLAEAQAEAMKTGNWGKYNRLVLQKSNAEVVPERVTKIEDGKALFLPDFKRLESTLQKKLMDPSTGFNERMRLQEKLTTLSLHWQESGIRDPGVVVALRDSIIGNLKEAGTMSLPEADMEAIFGEQRRHLAELNSIISEAQQKGLI